MSQGSLVTEGGGEGGPPLGLGDTLQLLRPLPQGLWASDSSPLHLGCEAHAGFWTPKQADVKTLGSLITVKPMNTYLHLYLATKPPP